jgi:regulator of protease activity HflC (stomatin/prohibitin superfamily)
MAQLLKPQNVKVVTKDGELIISLQLDININLNQSGTFDVNTSGSAVPAEVKKKTDDDVKWEIPDFNTTEKIKFGK